MATSVTHTGQATEVMWRNVQTLAAARPKIEHDSQTECRTAFADLTCLNRRIRTLRLGVFRKNP